MDDDNGLMVNFSFSPVSTSSTPFHNSKLSGTWKQRLKIKRSIQRTISAARLQDSAVNFAKPSRKTLSTAPTNTPRLNVSAPPPPARLIHGKPQLVSSLFTSNPTIPTIQTAPTSHNTTPSNAPQDTSTFPGLGLPSTLVSHLATQGVTHPTSIQRRAIPPLLTGNGDAILQSETGSGKTLAYLLPLLTSLLETHVTRSLGTLALILVPTRELAHQVLDVLRPLLPAHIVPGLIIGGEKKKSEKARLRKGVSVLVATPGRLLDHLKNTKSLEVARVGWLVLDEADRLLELGFEETLGEIVGLLEKRIKGSRRTVLCSATVGDGVKRLAGRSLKDPVFVGEEGKRKRLAGEEETFATPNQLRQTYIISPAKLKLVTLVAVLKGSAGKDSGKVVVFMSSCDSVDFHFEMFAKAGEDEQQNEEEEDDGTKRKVLRAMFKDKNSSGPAPTTQPTSTTGLILFGVPLFKLHGELPQVMRTRTCHDFAHASSGILFCTDVAARGLDLPGVCKIVQYDAPCDLKDYVHRVGRTARLGRAGEALIILLPSETDYVDVLRAQEISPEGIKVEEVLMRGLVKGKGKDFQTPATELQNMVERWALASPERINLARKAYWSSIRAYATHSAAEKHIFHVKRLHLGHIAKSFALREAPSDVVPAPTKSKKAAKLAVNQASKGGAVKVKRRNTNDASEFAIGDVDKMMGGPTTRKKKIKAK